MALCSCMHLYICLPAPSSVTIHLLAHGWSCPSFTGCCCAGWVFQQQHLHFIKLSGCSSSSSSFFLCDLAELLVTACVGPRVGTLNGSELSAIQVLGSKHSRTVSTCQGAGSAAAPQGLTFVQSHLSAWLLNLQVMSVACIDVVLVA